MEYPAEIFDLMQLSYTAVGWHDHTMHCVLKFADQLDAALLKKAVIASLETHPILATRFVPGDQPRWMSLDPERFCEAFAVLQNETDFERVLLSSIDEKCGPQVQVSLLKSSAASCAVAVTMNHMICDGAGFKQYLYLLARIYSSYASKSVYPPVAITGDRSPRRVLKSLSIGQKLRALSRIDTGGLSGNHTFVFSKDDDKHPFIVSIKINRENTAALIRYYRSRKATMNDLIMTAYYRCLFDKLNVSPDEELFLAVTVDMRRYLPEPQDFQVLTNLSMMIGTHLKYMSGEPFDLTLRRVKSIMEKEKAHSIGVGHFIIAGIVKWIVKGMRIVKSDKMKNLLNSTLKIPRLSMTNLGMLNADLLAFGSDRPVEALMCGAIKNKPYLQVAAISHNGELTISSNLYGSDADRETILSFLGEMENELLDACGMLTR